MKRNGTISLLQIGTLAETVRKNMGHALSMALDEIWSSYGKPLFPAPETRWPFLPSLLGTAPDYWGTKHIIDPIAFSMIKKRLS